MNQRGLSILELIIALSIGFVVLFAAGTFYRTVVWTSKADYSQAYMQNQATIVVSEIQRQVEAASTIVACYPGSGCIVDSCDGQDGSTAQSSFLYVSQPDGSIYCFYTTVNGEFREYRQPASGGSGHWNMLSPAQTPLTVTNFDICGAPPYLTGTCQTTTDIAYVSFRLQPAGLLGGSASASPLALSVAIAKRN